MLSPEDEINEKLKRAALETVEGRTVEAEQKRQEKLKADIKGYFESRKAFMNANRYKRGKVWIYPTSKACLKGVRL